MWPYKGLSIEAAIDAVKWNKHSTWRELIASHDEEEPDGGILVLPLW